MKFKKICVLGLGYIGLPTASTFAANDVEVIGVDVSQHVVETLQRGEIHIHEPGLRAVVSQAIDSGQLRVQSVPEPADAYIIAVPTPFYTDKAGQFGGDTYKLADMRAVASAAESIVPFLKPGNLVVLESTSPPGTTRNLVVPILERSGLKAGEDFLLAYSPERVLPGQILRELIENARVIGGITTESAEAGRDLYAIFVKGQILQTDATTAEMVKLMENTCRDVNIALANEFSRLADRFGVDVWEAIQLANLHPRINILSPGPGVGGHCISVDPWFFVEAAPELSQLIHEARRINDAQPLFVVELTKRALGSLQGRQIAALGLAYKPDVDDLRESPAVEVIHLLQAEGAIVKAYEPFKPQAELPGIHAVQRLEVALADADAILLLVAHAAFRELTASALAEKTKARIIVDTVNALDPGAITAAGFRLVRLGVGEPAEIQ